MYSQNKEEQVILDYFGFLQGTFLDIGANDGVTFSNTKMLSERGWKGVLVEPSPKAYARLKEIYKGIKGVYTYPFAIGDHNGTAILNESSSLVNPQDVALVSTMNPEEMERFNRVTNYTPIEVKMFRWKTFLNRLKYKTFDFISMDIEGMELDWVDKNGDLRQGVLPQIDLTETKMVCVEWNGKRKEEFIAACHGFRLIHENGENLIFAR